MGMGGMGGMGSRDNKGLGERLRLGEVGGIQGWVEMERYMEQWRREPGVLGMERGDE